MAKLNWSGLRARERGARGHYEDLSKRPGYRVSQVVYHPTYRPIRPYCGAQRSCGRPNYAHGFCELHWRAPIGTWIRPL